MRPELEKRLAALSAEIRAYPTPIARCDEQLAALLEERARLLEELTLMEEQGPCSPLALWANDGGFNAA
jgi:chorismate mutase